MATTRSRQPLSALEAAFLGLESHDVPFVHASILHFDRPIAVEPLRAHVAAALDGVARYHRRIVRKPLGGADWVDDTDYQIEHHVQAATVAAPGGPRELDELAAQLLQTDLPPEHSPWRLWTVTGVADGGGALISVFHHSLIDGLAGFRLLEHVLRAPGPAPVAAPPDQAEPAPPARRPGRLAAARGKLAALRQLVAPHNVAALARLLVEGLRPASEIGLNPRHIGPLRAVASHAVPLAMVQDIAHRSGATTNDVVLTAVSGALRRYLARRDLDPAQLHDVRAMVPVSRHAKTAREPEGNRVVLLLVPLAVDEADPIARLGRIAAATRQLKAGHSAGGGDLLVALSEITTPAMLVGVLRLSLRLRGFNVIVTNIPGPTVPLSLLGARLARITPIVNLWPRQAVGIAVASYAGQLVFGLQADRRVVADIDRLRDDLAAALDALREAAPAVTAAPPLSALPATPPPAPAAAPHPRSV